MFGREKWSLNARGHNLDKIRSEILWPGFAQILRADPRAEPWRGNQIPTRSHWGEGEGRRQGCPHALGAKVRGWRQGVPPLHTWGEAREGEGWRQGNPMLSHLGASKGGRKRHVTNCLLFSSVRHPLPFGFKVPSSPVFAHSPCSGKYLMADDELC